MTAPRVEVCDPIEGDAIRAALRERGLLVLRRTPTDLGRGAAPGDVVVLAAEVEGVRSLLRTLRALPDGGDRPVLLLGAPPGEPDFDAAAADEAGADGWLPRPVAIERLARKLETLLAPTDTQLRATARGARADVAPERPEAQGSRSLQTDSAWPAPAARERTEVTGRVRPDRTVRLDEDGGFAAPIEFTAERREDVSGRPGDGARASCEEDGARGPAGDPERPESSAVVAAGESAAAWRDASSGLRQAEGHADDAPRGPGGGWTPASDAREVAARTGDRAPPPDRDGADRDGAGSDGAGHEDAHDADARRHDAPPRDGLRDGGDAGPRSDVEALLRAASDVAPAGARRGTAAVISERLREALLAADQRVFPDEAPLEPAFPADDEGPEELVPQELLDDAAAPVVAAADDDPLEAFTHVLAMVPASGTPMPVRTPGSVAPGTSPRTPGPLTPRSARAAAPAPTPMPVPAPSLAATQTAALADLRRNVAPSTAPGVTAPPLTSARAADSVGADGESTTARAGLRAAGSARGRPSALPAASGCGSVRPMGPDSVLGLPAPGGALGGASERDWGLLRVLARICTRRLDGYLDVVLGGGEAEEDTPRSSAAAWHPGPRAGELTDGGPWGGSPGTAGVPVRLVFRAGEVRRVEADVARRAARSLARELRVGTPEPLREHEASRWLGERASRSTAERLRVERHLAQARLEVLAAITTAIDATWSLTPLGPEDGEGRALAARPFGTATAAALVEVARRGFDARRARRALGGPVRLWATSEADAVFGAAALPIELAALTEGAELSFDAVVAATAPHEGYAGALLALAAFGAVGVGHDDEGDDAAEDDECLLDAAAALAEDGDYFAILGVDAAASAREIHEAYARRRRDLLPRARAPRIGASAHAPDPSDDPRRREALRALDDALDVLGDDALRARYARALGLRGAAAEVEEPRA